MNPSTKPERTSIGVDMTAPYGVYVNGECVAEYATQKEAEEHFRRLRGERICVEEAFA